MSGGNAVPATGSQVASLVLASTSPRRKAILEEAGIVFSVLDPGLSDEDEARLASSWKHVAPSDIARRLAVAKALAAATRAPFARAVDPLRAPAARCAILAADTVVIHDGEALGKPRDRAHAKQLIERLAGRTHEVATGVAYYEPSSGVLDASVEVSRVSFKKIDAAALETFLASGTWAGKAGAYGVQDAAAAPIVDRVEGSKSNVVGLPVERVQSLLKKRGVLALLLAGWLLAGCTEKSPPTPPPLTPPASRPTPPPPSPPPGDSVRKVPQPFEGKPSTGLPLRELSINGKKIEVELACDYDERQLGLMHRNSMPDDHGMLFIYPPEKKEFHSFWMQNTRIPLSIAFIRDDGTIANIEDMQPLEERPSHSSKEPVRLALELNQGWFKLHSVGPNAKVEGVVELLPLGKP